MSHGTEHHLDEAEHAQHATHDPFNRRVAMTMAVLAAVLACLSLASHRAHNETLDQQIISGKHTTEAANQWSRYQAKVIRGYLYESQVKELPLLAKDPRNSRAEEQTQALVEEMRQKMSQWKHDTDEISKEATEHTDKAREAAEKSEKAHHQSLFFDGGEGGVELALVLCSVAMLARRRAFWYAGMVIGGIGLAVALAGFFVSAPHESSEEHKGHASASGRVVAARELGNGRGGLPGGGTAAPAGGQEGIDAQGHEQAA